MMLHTEQEACDIKVRIIEVGYIQCNILHGDKVPRFQHKAKIEQHKKLHDALRNAGYQCDIIPIVLGSTGGIFDSNLSGMRQLGISHERSLILIRKLSEHAADYMQSIIDLRRRLERERDPHNVSLQSTIVGSGGEAFMLGPKGPNRMPEVAVGCS